MLIAMSMSEQVREQFLRDGYLVIPDVVPLSLCERVIGAITEFAGVKADHTEGIERFAGLGIVPVHHHQTLWDVRQHPGLYDVFRTLYGEDALWVSMDRAGYKPPASAHTRQWQRAPVHWDCDPWHFNDLSLQGLVYLSDTGPDQGPFSCVPSIYRDLDAYRFKHKDSPDRRNPVVSEDDLIGIPGKAGSLVVFHRLMPHTNRINTTDRPRFVQYVTMQPAGGEEERLRRVQDWQHKMPPLWAIQQKIQWQQIPEPGDPAVLTNLGEKLVGVSAW